MSKTARERLTPIDGAEDRPVYVDDREETYHTWYDTAAYEPVSTALVVAVASIRGVDVEDLERVSRYVDPDALNALVRHWDERDEREGRGRRTISFPFGGCAVTVYADGEIVIDPT
ncbi:HalOD1 output domain-containing protein [Natronolimnohabitans innermongolicus]|uniref:Halobacterial output domain-containing protein n=1 Tax=Natronolimnohabitans innermongolicus JCM 12255 TaxID=1227499 RepID=L9XDE7_9EURY|nr:HalOD1 output domain-containing protein [Natronolimnohabitans innermongolicus]ELY59652.1 hypothetical protein C493_05008 [Natronolimnohabitans innermongolicus JCM 12255]